jgi:PGF-CTERM protein
MNMRRKQQFGLVVLVITVVGLLIVGAGSVFAQNGTETTTANRTPTEVEATATMSTGTTVTAEGPDLEEKTDTGQGTDENKSEESTRIIGNATEDNTTTENGPDVSLRFPDQRSDGTTVYVESVTLPDGGFVAIHDNYTTPRNTTIEVNGTPTEIISSNSIIGVSSYLDPGTHQNVTVQLFNLPGEESDRAQLTQSYEDMVATVHRDTNGNTAFDFTPANRTVDTPYRVPFILSGDTVRQQGPAIGVGTVAVGESVKDVLGYDPKNVTGGADAVGTGENGSTGSVENDSGTAGSGEEGPVENATEGTVTESGEDEANTTGDAATTTMTTTTGMSTSERGDDTETTQTTEGSGPGFTLVVAALALLGAALIAARHT